MQQFAVIFDMDGVLVDSNKYILDSFNTILQPHNFSIGHEQFKQYMGITAKGLVEKWKQRYNLAFDENFIKEETTKLQIDYIKNHTVDADLLRFLNELKINKVPIGIGTGSPRIRAEKILDALKIKEFFSIIVTGDEINEHKPHPEMFLKVSEKLQIEPRKCVVIEDAANGIEAAKRGNMKAIGYLTKYHTKQELGKADMIFNDFSELNLVKIRNLIQ